MDKRATVEGEMRKNPQLRMEDINALKEWAQKQPHLPPLSEMKIILFLHACQCSVEQTKITIDNYFTFRANVPQVCAARDPFSEELKESARAIGLAILDGTDNNGNIVLFHRLLDTDPLKYNMELSMKRTIMVMDIWQLENGTAAGATLIYDQKGFGLSHMTRAPISAVRNVVHYVQDCAPINVNSIHIINANAVIDAILAIFKPFMNKTLFSKIQTHREGEYSNFYKSVPKSMLPKEYGGDAPPLADLNDMLMKKLEHFKDFFEEEDKLVADEKKRPASSKGFQAFVGSFKKLDID